MNFKKTLNTSYIISSIKKDVDYAIQHYNNGNSEWKTYVRISYYKFRTLLLVGLESDFSTAYEELVQETGYRKLYKYKEISDYILKLTDIDI